MVCAAANAPTAGFRCRSQRRRGGSGASMALRALRPLSDPGRAGRDARHKLASMRAAGPAPAAGVERWVERRVGMRTASMVLRALRAGRLLSALSHASMCAAGPGPAAGILSYLTVGGPIDASMCCGTTRAAGQALRAEISACDELQCVPAAGVTRYITSSTLSVASMCCGRWARCRAAFPRGRRTPATRFNVGSCGPCARCRLACWCRYPA